MKVKAQKFVKKRKKLRFSTLKAYISGLRRLKEKMRQPIFHIFLANVLMQKNSTKPSAKGTWSSQKWTRSVFLCKKVSNHISLPVSRKLLNLVSSDREFHKVFKNIYFCYSNLTSLDVINEKVKYYKKPFRRWWPTLMFLNFGKLLLA